MKVLSIIFSACIFASTCFGQAELFKKMSNNKNSLHPPSKAQKLGSASFQLVSTTNLELDMQTLKYDTSTYASYSYNAQGNELVVEERTYYENGGDLLSKNIKSYDSKGFLVKEEKFEFNFNTGQYYTRSYSEFENNQEGLALKENIYQQSDTSFSSYVLYVYDANDNVVKDDHYVLRSGVFEQAYYSTALYTNDGQPIEYRDYSCSGGSCQLNQGMDFKYFPNGLRESETNFEFVGGINVPYATRMFEYDIDNRVVKVSDLSYEAGVSFEDEEFELIYDASGLIDSVYINEFDLATNTWSRIIEIVDFEKNKDVDRTDVLLPNEFSDDFFIYNIFFSKKLDGFRTLGYNGDGSIEHDEIMKLEYSNFTSVSEQTVFDFTLSPNPASDVIKIGLNDNNTQRIEVYSITGVLMYAEKVNGKELNIDIQKFEKGTYLVKAIGANGFRTKQFVKR